MLLHSLTLMLLRKFTYFVQHLCKIQAYTIPYFQLLFWLKGLVCASGLFLGDMGASVDGSGLENVGIH